jgi:hypothetical protein
MNEQIRELAIQSGIVESHVDWDDAGGLLIEKFAELIVEECIAMADNFEYDVNYGGLVNRMKQHFGVEE